MARTPSDNSKGLIPGSLKDTFAKGPIMTDADKKADEAFKKQFEFFKKLQELYKPLSYKDTYYAKQVKEYIIGQDDAVDKLAYIIYHNLHQNMMDDYHDLGTRLFSVVVVGPSGCGKTATLQAFARILGLPFCRYNATPLTSGGFVGKDVEVMLRKLIDEAGGDMDLAQRGILYIDEIDKKVSSNPSNTSGRDINGTAVQEELLKFLEPSVIDLGNDTYFDTSHLTVLMTGRFLGIEKIRKKRVTGIKNMGFRHIENEEDPNFVPQSYDEDEYNEFDDSQADTYIHQDVIDFGFLDELVGRVFEVVEFRKLSRSNLVDVILAKGSPLQHFVKSLAVKGQELLIDPAVFERMADAAYNSPRGARCLDSIVEHFLIPADRDFMLNYRPGIMEYDADGNYSSIFESKVPGEYIYKQIEGPRSIRRKRILEEMKKAEEEQKAKESKKLDEKQKSEEKESVPTLKVESDSNSKKKKKSREVPILEVKED
ncbi:MAG: AAA family ATPase [Clostridia bacterium]|nr:AAA family ATPase [Clostridia bacterium]